MRTIHLLIPTLLVCAVVVYAETLPERQFAAREAAFPSAIRAGDLVFQDLACGERCALIRRHTRSPYTHVGVVTGEGDARVVWEAFAPVSAVPLAEWAARGRGEAIAVYRPVPALAPARASVEAAIRAMRGRPYDADYLWDDERIYCSELVAKAYLRATGRALVVPHTIDFGADEARVRALSHGRLDGRTRMVTPVDLIRSGRFTRIVDELAPATASAAR